jgi:hypothetical protein
MIWDGVHSGGILDLGLHSIRTDSAVTLSTPLQFSPLQVLKKATRQTCRNLIILYHI